MLFKNPSTAEVIRAQTSQICNKSTGRNNIWPMLKSTPLPQCPRGVSPHLNHSAKWAGFVSRVYIPRDQNNWIYFQSSCRPFTVTILYCQVGILGQHCLVIRNKMKLWYCPMYFFFVPLSPEIDEQLCHTFCGCSNYFLIDLTCILHESLDSNVINSSARAHILQLNIIVFLTS